MPIFTPRSIEDRVYWTQPDPRRMQLLAAITKDASDVPARPSLPSASDYLAARRSNNRGLVDNHWHSARMLMSRLVISRLVGGVDDQDDRLLNWLFDLTSEPSWTVSAHLPAHDLPLTGRGQLDLAGTEMAAELAEIREVALPWMRRQTQTLDESIVREIDRRCLTPFCNDAPEWWADVNYHTINNWSGVCGGALLAACVSLEKQGFPRPQAKRKAIETINLFLRRGFTPSGECDEGPGYWSYGMAYAVIGLSRLSEEELRGEIDYERLKVVADYPRRAHLLGNRFYSDNDAVGHITASLGLYAFIAHISGASFPRWMASSYPAPATGRTICSMLRDLAAVNEVSGWKEPAPTHPAGRFLPDQQVAILQRPSQRGLVSFILAGGNNGESHNHNDLGAFQVIVDDTAWIPDLGSPEYKTDFFGPHRYEKYIVAASSGHNCPSVNGYEQRVGSEAACRVLDCDVEEGRLLLDATAAYAPEAGLKQWTRGIASPPAAAEARIIDDFVLSRDGEVTHRIWFSQKPQVNGRTITCGPLKLDVDPSCALVSVNEFRAGDPRLLLRVYPADHLLYRLDMRFTAKAGEPRTITTRIVVG